MPSHSIHVSSRRPRAMLVAFAALFSLAACQPQSRAADAAGAAASSSDVVVQPKAQAPAPKPAPMPSQRPVPKSDPLPPPAPDATPGNVVLGFGDETTVAPGTQLRFVRVVNDSRCPKGVQCVWAGEVKIEFELNSPSGKNRFELASSRSPGTTVGIMQFELKDYGPCPSGSNRLADAECATVAITTATTQ